MILFPSARISIQIEPSFLSTIICSYQDGRMPSGSFTVALQDTDLP